MTTHTPGPWVAELIEAPIINGQTIGAPNGNILAGNGRTGGDWIASVKPFSDSFYANARLLAAAPDLLEACREMLQGVEGHERRTGATQLVGCVVKLRAAIAKATATT